MHSGHRRVAQRKGQKERQCVIPTGLISTCEHSCELQQVERLSSFTRGLLLARRRRRHRGSAHRPGCRGPHGGAQEASPQALAPLQYNEAITRADFKKRLEKAARGGLQPPGEIKSLRAGDILFEIRWAGIPVHERPPTGLEHHTTAEVRLIHAQPYDELGLCVLGLHAHEKAIIDGDAQATKRLQDYQIDLAEQLFYSGRSTCWGVQRRSQHESELPTRTPSS